MTFSVDDIHTNPPRVHEADGELVSWSLELAALRYIDHMAQRSSSTLEIGIGASTMVFAIHQCRHVAITPSKLEIDRAADYARQNNVGLDSIRFLVGRSQDILPTLRDQDIDFAVIDGDHAFPIPILDWMYVAERLAAGGVVFIDDAQIWTGDILRRFLREEPGWEMDWEDGRAFAFRKLSATSALRSWSEQPFVARRSLVWGAAGWTSARPDHVGSTGSPVGELPNWLQRYGLKSRS